jgi:hypothetical protein
VIVPLIGVACKRALDGGQERVLRGGDLVGGDAKASPMAASQAAVPS